MKKYLLLFILTIGLLTSCSINPDIPPYSTNVDLHNYTLIVIEVGDDEIDGGYVKCLYKTPDGESNNITFYVGSDFLKYNLGDKLTIIKQ